MLVPHGIGAWVADCLPALYIVSVLPFEMKSSGAQYGLGGGLGGDIEGTRCGLSEVFLSFG